MSKLTRRTILKSGGAAAGTLLLPRFAIGQADNRPSVTIAVVKVTNSNVLDELRRAIERRRARVLLLDLGGPISKNWRGSLEAKAGLATEWHRNHDQTVEVKLRQGVKFHNSDELKAEDVVFSCSRVRMLGETGAKSRSTIQAFEKIPTPRPGKELPPDVPAVARYIWPDLVRVDAIDKCKVPFYSTRDARRHDREAGCRAGAPTS